MELYGDAMEYPAIHAQIALGTEDLTVKVVASLPRWTASFWGGLSDLFFFFSFAGERSWGRRAAAQDRPPVHLHVLHGSSAQLGRFPRCSSGQYSKKKHGSKTTLRVSSSEPCLVFAGWLRVRPSHLPTVRALLSGRPEALLLGGLRNRCCDLHPGD